MTNDRAKAEELALSAYKRAYGTSPDGNIYDKLFLDGVAEDAIKAITAARNEALEDIRKRYAELIAEDSIEPYTDKDIRAIELHMMSWLIDDDKKGSDKGLFLYRLIAGIRQQEAIRAKKEG